MIIIVSALFEPKARPWMRLLYIITFIDRSIRAVLHSIDYFFHQNIMGVTREIPVHVIHYYRTEDVTLPPCISRVGTISSATAILLLSVLF